MSDHTYPTFLFLKALQWSGTLFGIGGAGLLAANTGASAYGFVGFLISSVCWAIAGSLMREPSIVVLYVFYIGINLIGVVRWLS